MPVIDNLAGASPFAPNAGLQALQQLNQMLRQDVIPMADVYAQAKQDKQPLGKLLGVPEDKMPAGLAPLYNTPIGKIRQFSALLGPQGLKALMENGLVWDPKTNSFTMQSSGGAPGAPVPLKGASAKDVVSAMKQQQPKPGGITPQSVQQTADAVVNGKLALQQLPGFGANSLKSQVVAELAHRGVNMANLDLDFQAKKDYLKTVNGPAFQQTYKLLNSIKPNMDTILKLSKSIDRTKYPSLNRAQLALMAQSGDKNVAAFGAATIEVADQIAKILQGGGTGSGTSDKKLTQANELLNGNYNVDQLLAITNTMGNLLDERQKALKTITVQTFGNQKAQKAEPAARFKQLVTQFKGDESKAYQQMAKEGY